MNIEMASDRCIDIYVYMYIWIDRYVDRYIVMADT